MIVNLFNHEDMHLSTTNLVLPNLPNVQQYVNHSNQ
jgi:hypothetical protein